MRIFALPSARRFYVPIVTIAGIAFLIPLLLAGCAAQVGRKPIAWEQIKTTQGVLIVTGGAPETCARDGFMILIKPAAEPRRFFNAAPTLQPQNYLLGSDFDSVHARVHAFVLDPGDYGL